MVFPIRGGRYEVSPGLRKLDLAREKIFWVDDDYQHQIAEKRRYSVCRKPVHVAEGADREAIDDMLVAAGARFVEEHPAQPLRLGQRLGMQVQEDLAVVQETPVGNRVVYLHISFPNGWDPAEKIGGSFAHVHGPVAHFEKMAAQEDKIVGAMVDQGPFERFAWGVHECDELDRFGRADCWSSCIPESVVFRAERQTTLGFPEHRGALFTIHTFLTPLRDLKAAQKLDLADALDSMDDAARSYKGYDEVTIRRLTEYLRRT